jgi:hypothetical protein
MKFKLGMIRPQILVSIGGLITISIISLFFGIETIATGCVAGIIALSKDLVADN